MSLTCLPLRPDTIELCVSLWPDRIAFSDDEFGRAINAARKLLAEGRALGSVILNNGRACAYTLSTFVQDTLIDEYLRAPHPQIGKRLLLDAAVGGAQTVLDRHSVADRNRDGGLQLVIVSANDDPTIADPITLFGRLLQAFVDAHRGYRITRILDEVFLLPDRTEHSRSGSLDVLRMFDEVAPGTRLPSAVGVLTRERAMARKAPLLCAFAYEPPRVGFTPSEQRVLSAALTGDTDESLSAHLGIGISSIKARWTRIQQRAMHRVPEIFRNIPAQRGNGRGAQTRHLILDYVRNNASELTPYSWPLRRDGAVLRKKASAASSPNQ